MDLSKYIKNGTIDDKVVAELLCAKNGKIEIYAVVSSIYDDAEEIGEGFFYDSLNSEHLLSKNYAPAEKKFNELYNKLRAEHMIIENKLPTKDMAEKEIDNEKEERINIAFGEFSLSFGGNINFLDCGFNKGWEAYKFGDKIKLWLHKVKISLNYIKYADEHNAICYTGGRRDVANYLPIIID
jgi:hypothetical protein